ncbi:zf-HC2 domain-containing protein [Streptomyces sp. NPDC059568]|uniref:zf-HC2 domain-containing protein n=1 Tax=Streptomyces sp. NPDC059568 TaxID=3346868 RepID=UPI00369F280D
MARRAGSDGGRERIVTGVADGVADGGGTADSDGGTADSGPSSGRRSGSCPAPRPESRPESRPEPHPEPRPESRPVPAGPHVRTLLGAHVLGALAPEEDRLVVDHLAGCDLCGTAYLEVAGMPSLLALCDEDDLL